MSIKVRINICSYYIMIRLFELQTSSLTAFKKMCTELKDMYQQKEEERNELTITAVSVSASERMQSFKDRIPRAADSIKDEEQEEDNSMAL